MREIYWQNLCSNIFIESCPPFEPYNFPAAAGQANYISNVIHFWKAILGSLMLLYAKDISEMRESPAQCERVDSYGDCHRVSNTKKKSHCVF